MEDCFAALAAVDDALEAEPLFQCVGGVALGHRTSQAGEGAVLPAKRPKAAGRIIHDHILYFPD
jgi:hypothetical protein